MKELIDFIVLIIIYFWKFYRKWKSKGKDTLFVNTTMYIYLSFVIGGIIGYVIYSILKPIIDKILNSIKNK